MADSARATLSNDAIAQAIESFEYALGQADVPRRLIVRATILMEELLLRYQERLGSDAEFSFDATKRLGTILLHVEVKGEQLNALDLTTSDDEFGSQYDFVSELMESEIAPPTYGYRRGRNGITLSVRVQKQRPIWANPFLVATVLAVLAFIVLSHMGAGYVSAITEAVVSPIVATLMGVLKALTGPLLSLSLITGICAMGDVATLESVGKRALLRIAVWTVLILAVSTVACSFVFQLAGSETGTGFNASELFGLLLSSIPTNLFSPFVENNMLQIVVESAFAGICLLALGERSTRIRELVIELNSLVFKMMFLFSEVLPLLIGLSLFKTLAITDLSSLGSVGLVIATCFGIVALITIGALLWVRATLHVPIALFIKKLMPGLAICLTTGSSTSAMGEFYRIPKEELGVDEAISDFLVPIGHAVFTPSTIVPLVVGVFAAARMDGADFGLSRVAIMSLLVLQLSFTTPKVPGGLAATYTIILTQLGLSLENLGFFMAANVFMCNPTVVFGDPIRYVEVCAFAETEGALDKERLRAA